MRDCSPELCTLLPLLHSCPAQLLHALHLNRVRCTPATPPHCSPFTANHSATRLCFYTALTLSLPPPQALKHLRCVQVLNFGDCLVRSEGAVAIAESLREGLPILKVTLGAASQAHQTPSRTPSRTPKRTKRRPARRPAHAYMWGECGSGGKSCRLAVGGLPVRTHPGRVEVSLSETPNPQSLLTRAGWYLAWQPIAVGV